MSNPPTPAHPALEDVLLRAYPGNRGAHPRQILYSALACFDESGLEPTTIDMIRERSGSSVGSIYHHFKSKEGIAAALFFAALDDQNALIAARLQAAHDIRASIEAMITSYMDWVTERPELARFLFQARSYVAKSPFAAELAERNKQRYLPIDKMLTQAAAAGALLALPRETYPSLLIGQAENYCRAWLSGRVKTAPKKLAPIFAAAAWRSIAAG